MRNPRPATMADTLSRQAEQQPGKRAFLFLERGERETETFTFAELDRRARSIAQVLLEYRLEGQRVVLNYPSCLEFVAALFGCFYAGAVAVPAPTGGYGNSLIRTSTILRDAKAAAVLSLRSMIAAIAETPDRNAGQQNGVLHLASDEMPTSDARPPRNVHPESPALLQYTSGSTGDPRGVILTHSNLVHNQLALSEAFDSHAEDIGVSWLPLYHDMGLMSSILHTVYLGAFCALMPSLAFVQNPIRWLRAITRYRATISGGPCFAFDFCARQYTANEDGALDVSSWRAAICGGEAIRPRALQKFAETFRPAGFRPQALMAGYGLAEATLMVTLPAAGTGLRCISSPRAAGEMVENRLGWRRELACCGQPWSGQRVAIVDPVSCRRLPDGQAGEIWIQGPSVARGYWNRDEETRAVFHAELAGEAHAGRWLRSGDLGFLSNDGLAITGRRKEIIVIRGANYDPIDIETTACESHPAVAESSAAAFSVELEDGEQVVLALEMERRRMESLNVETLVGQIASAVNRRFGLTVYDLVLRPGSLPRTTSGKIQRHICRELYLTNKQGAFQWIDHPILGRCRARTEEWV